MENTNNKKKYIPVKDQEIKDSNRTFGQRIRQFRKEAGISQKTISNMLNVSRNTVVNWEAGRYRPDTDLFPELCDILGISLNDLFGIHPEERVTPHEKTLLDQYRQLSPGGQRIIFRIIHDMLDEELKEKEIMLDKNVIMLAHISTVAAAGNGFSFSDVPVDDYCFVFKDERNKHADGIIRVKGKSMEPVYRNGESVYVQYTESAEIGEDVICSSSEGIHIKRLGENIAYSLNKDYPFEPNGEVRIIGKVLGIVSSRDCPNQTELASLESIRHDEIREFKEIHGLAEGKDIP